MVRGGPNDYFSSVLFENIVKLAAVEHTRRRRFEDPRISRLVRHRSSRPIRDSAVTEVFDRGLVHRNASLYNIIHGYIDLVIESIDFNATRRRSGSRDPVKKKTDGNNTVSAFAAIPF